MDLTQLIEAQRVAIAAYSLEAEHSAAALERMELIVQGMLDRQARLNEMGFEGFLREAQRERGDGPDRTSPG